MVWEFYRAFISSRRLLLGRVDALFVLGYLIGRQRVASHGFSALDGGLALLTLVVGTIRVVRLVAPAIFHPKDFFVAELAVGHAGSPWDREKV